MNNTLLLSFFILTILIIIGGFLYMLTCFFQSEKERRNFEFKMKYSENILPNKLQAYERMALFLERIKPASLARRIAPIGNLKSYEYALIEAIQTEFEHNLAQQIYINPETWTIIFSAKNATQVFVKEIVRSSKETASAQDLQEEIIKKSINSLPPSSSAILYLQKDIQRGV